MNDTYKLGTHLPSNLHVYLLFTQTVDGVTGIAFQNHCRRFEVSFLVLLASLEFNTVTEQPVSTSMDLSVSWIVYVSLNMGVYLKHYQKIAQFSYKRYKGSLYPRSPP